MSIGWVVYEEVSVLMRLPGKQKAEYVKKGVRLGRVVAPNRARACDLAGRRWPHKDSLVQSEISASVEERENVVGTFRPGAHQVKH